MVSFPVLFRVPPRSPAVSAQKSARRDAKYPDNFPVTGNFLAEMGSRSSVSTATHAPVWRVDLQTGFFMPDVRRFPRSRSGLFSAFPAAILRNRVAVSRERFLRVRFRLHPPAKHCWLAPGDFPGRRTDVRTRFNQLTRLHGRSQLASWVPSGFGTAAPSICADKRARIWL